MPAYYNEHDPYAAEWLRSLISEGLVAPGDVDERSIEDVTPKDLKGYTQCHFFAGIGGWSLALRLAGWPDDKPVWTGSCPCQSFSAAGKGAGFADERHLWPAWFHLIEQCRPPVVFGEQVEAAVRHGWLDLVQADLEGAGYAVGSADICAAGIGAPHIRQRLWFVADSIASRRERFGRGGEKRITEYRKTGGVADAERNEKYQEQQRPEENERKRSADSVGRCGLDSGLADADHDGRSRPKGHAPKQGGDRAEDGLLVGGDTGICEPARPGPVNGFWRDADWRFCKDGKWRPVEPGLECLVTGLPFKLADGRTRKEVPRKDLLKGFGNAIVPQVAATFIESYMETL